MNKILPVWQYFFVSSLPFYGIIVNQVCSLISSLILRYLLITRRVQKHPAVEVFLINTSLN